MPVHYPEPLERTLLPTNQVSDFSRNFAQLQKHVKQPYSVMKVVRALLSKPSHLDGYEIEVSQELKRLNPTRNVGGVLVPIEAFGVTRRDLTSVSPTIQTTVEDEIIPFLRVKTVAGRCGATLLDGLSGGNLLLPRATATAGAGWYAELAPIPPADQAFDSISMSPKLIAGQTIVSNQLIRQSSPDIEAFVIRDISDAIAVQIDQAALFGAGSTTVPKGIMSYSANAPGASAYGLRAPNVTFGAAADWSHVLQFEKNLEDCRVFNDGSFAFVSSPATRNKWQAAPKVAGTGYQFLWEQRDDEMDGRVNGRKAVSSAQMTGDIVLLGKFSEMLIGTWLGVDINLNSHTRAQQAETAITVTMLVDIAFRYSSAFCASTDSGAQ
jgi:HK97 family phage major capsid protein